LILVNIYLIVHPLFLSMVLCLLVSLINKMNNNI